MNFSHNSTWRGIIAIIGAIAIIIEPEKISVIVPAILALIGAINVIREN